ncbi:MAG: S41 family peptidase, partial [Bacteroidota bacterium]
EPIEDIVDRLLPLIVTDGFNETSRWEWLGSATFSQLYRLTYGPFKSFSMGVQRYGERNIRTVEIPAIRFTRFKGRNAQFAPKVFDYKQFTFKVIDDTIAYLSVTGFGSDELDYASFYRSSFQRIKDLDIQHLVLDIQDNGGGTEGNENLLFSYVYPDVVQKYKRVTMLSGPYEKNKEDSDYILDKWAPQRGFAERGEYTLFSDYYSTLGYQKPEEDLVYDGMIYALISGITFSGGAEFSSMLRMTNRAIFIGEETGGTYEGNVSGYSETTQLPNSKITVDIPTVHFQMNVEPILPGRGVLPDYEVHQTWADYMETRNAKLDFALELIRQ